MSNTHFDLTGMARAEMIQQGFHPDFAPGTDEQLAALKARKAPVPVAGTRDLRDLPWSSIDNDTSRDLDQVEVAERIATGIQVRIGIADVDSAVPKDSPIDRHAASETTSVYASVDTFPMIPEELSTDLTSLNEHEDRAVIVIEFVVTPDGKIAAHDIYRALIRNQAQLTYNATGAWLEGRAAAPPKLAASPELQAQLKLQDEAATALRDERHRQGALNFDRTEPVAIVNNGNVQGVQPAQKTRANDLIADFMIAANGVMARTLTEAGVSTIRRIVKTPERWPRIVELAARYNERLPVEADSAALSAFLERMHQSDPVHYDDISLAVVKLMGPGEYVLQRAQDKSTGHFGLAAQDYTHSTAPNRRFTDLVTQRLLKAVWAKEAPPYSDAELAAIAQACTMKENAARKVERAMLKRVTAVALQDRVHQTFSGVITGASEKGVYVRVFNPPVEGRVVRGEEGMDVGDQVRVTLLSADPRRGFIDFGRA